jgi:hypothetical protein
MWKLDCELTACNSLGLLVQCTAFIHPTAYGQLLLTHNIFSIKWRSSERRLSAKCHEINWVVVYFYLQFPVVMKRYAGKLRTIISDCQNFVSELKFISDFTNHIIGQDTSFCFWIHLCAKYMHIYTHTHTHIYTYMFKTYIKLTQQSTIEILYTEYRN